MGCEEPVAASDQSKADRGSVIPAGVVASLSVVDGSDRGRLKKMRSRRLVLGRKSGDFVLKDPKISSTHAAIEYEKGSFILYDLNSTNGTFVNDVRITEKELSDLDEIRVGFTTLLFRVTRKKNLWILGKSFQKVLLKQKKVKQTLSRLEKMPFYHLKTT